MNLFTEFKDYIILILGSFASAVGVVATTMFSNRRDIDALKIAVDFLVKSKSEHESKVDSQLSEIRNDIKNLLTRK